MSQISKLENMFKAHSGEWIPLPTILAMGIAQDNARIKQLRDEEHMYIQNKIRWLKGEKYSWFRYDPHGQDEIHI